jgi:hypothetical protein
MKRDPAIVCDGITGSARRNVVDNATQRRCVRDTVKIDTIEVLAVSGKNV